MVSGYSHAGADFTVLNANLVVFGAVTEPANRGLHAIFLLQRLQIYDLVSSEFGEFPVGRLGHLNLEWHRDREIGAWRLLIEYEKIVIVYSAPDGAAARVFQSVFQHHLRFPFDQPHSLMVDITVARRWIG